MLEELYQVIEERKRNPSEGSYTARLLYGEKGLNGILEKFGEEAVEVILAAKDGKREEIIHEVADLLYHLLVLLSKLEIKLDDVYDELRRRRR